MSKIVLTPRAALQLLSRPLLIAFGFSFFVNVLTLTLPIYMMVVYDKVLTSRSQETLIALSVMAVFALVCYGLLEAVRARIAQGIDRWLDENLTGEIQRLQLENAAAARKKLPGGLGDLRNLRQAFSGPPLFAVFDTVWAPFFLLVIFLIHPLLGFIASGGAVVLTLLAVVTELLVRAPQKVAGGFATQTAEISQLATRNAEAVEALGMTTAVLDRILKSAAEARAHQMMATRRSSDMANVTMVVRLFIQILLIACGLWLTLDHAMTAGAMIASTLIMGRALQPFTQMMRTWQTIVMARMAFHQLDTFLSSPRVPRSEMTFPPPKGHVTVENVSYVPPDSQKPILTGINMRLLPGEALGIIGPSAAGKSTLARLLVGVWLPTAGKVRLDGIDISTWSRGDLGPHIGYVPQDVELLAGTVRENIARHEQASDEQIVAAAQAANAHELIIRLPKGYDTDIGDGGSLLSGGQKQRIALARAMFDDPKYIILDEPNSNLDTEGEAAILTALAAAKARGATIVIIAHRPSLFSFVDKLLVMRDGRVEKFGERQAVMAAMQPRPKVVGPSHRGPSSPPLPGLPIVAEPKTEIAREGADLSARAERQG
jgi:ATP-binding cassette, subfamily C, type I secretion system permease/ATPase